MSRRTHPSAGRRKAPIAGYKSGIRSRTLTPSVPNSPIPIPIPIRAERKLRLLTGNSPYDWYRFWGHVTPAPVSLWVLDVKSGRASMLPRAQSLVLPRWSPDGHYLATLSLAKSNLILYDLQTHEQTQVADGPADFRMWSPDGQFLGFRSGTGQEGGSGPFWCRMRLRDLSRGS